MSLTFHGGISRWLAAKMRGASIILQEWTKRLTGGHGFRRSIFQFRYISYVFPFRKAKKVKDEQDSYCEKAFTAEREGKLLEEQFPETPLDLDQMVEILRGRVKVNTHCYETT
jgi:hypothetical protein